jgi:hypothetical protein
MVAHDGGVWSWSNFPKREQAPASTSQGTTSDYINLINTNTSAITDHRTTFDFFSFFSSR